VAAFGISGAQPELAKGLREYRLEQPQAGWQVHDPARVLSSIDSALAECVAGLGDAEVVAISIQLPCMACWGWMLSTDHSHR
jgi:sugar (pentulose or hexulose) kinase